MVFSCQKEKLDRVHCSVAGNSPYFSVFQVNQIVSQITDSTNFS